MAQDELFKFDNPLKIKFGVDFFKNLPTLPGVYWFLDKNKKLLYVGKAKCLKTRVTSANWRLKNIFKGELRDPNRIGQMELDDPKVKFQSRFT
jgi:hypothetical protein